MSSDETPKIEPTLTAIDSPSIAPEAAKPEAATPAAPKIEATETAKPETPVEASTEATIEPKKIEPKVEAPTLPPAGQLAEPINAVITFKRPEPKAETIAPPPRSATRFALLAACVAIAASFGAIGGSLGVAKFGPTFTTPQPVAAIAKDNVAEEVKALKDTVAQLRGATKSLSDNLSALKTSVTTSNTTQNTQIGKIAETLDRVEKAQADQRKIAAAPAPTPAHAADITGSIGQQKQVPLVLGEPPTTLKPPIVQGWVLRRVYDGAALIESRDGIIEVEPGSIAPGLGRIEGIKRQDGRWVVLTARGIVVGR